jgi:hypothetical protein
MDTARIIADLKAEISRLQTAVAALEGIYNSRGRRHAGKRLGRKPEAKRRLTAAGRKRLSQLMKQRWAARKAKGKSTL